MVTEQPHAGSVTSGPKTPEAPENPEKKPESKTKSPKAKPPIGQYEYIGQDDIRFLFQERETKKCFTIDKRLLQYRGEGGFRVEVLEHMHK